MNYAFPIALILNTLSMTALLVGLGLTGKNAMAAEVGIVQGATLALFYTFSANARNIVLNPSSRISARSILTARILLAVPIGIGAFCLSVYVADIGSLLAVTLILRRCVEWIGELHLTEMEKHGHRAFAHKFIVLQSVLLVLALVWTVGDTAIPLLGLFLWALCPLLISLRFIRQQMTTRGWLQEAWVQMLPHLGSTAMIGITVYVFRLLILLIVGKETAGDLFTAFALGSVLGSVFANAIGPSLVLHEMRTGEQSFPWPLKMTLGLWAVAGVTLFLALQSSPASFQWTGRSNMFWGAVGLSMIGGVVMVFGQRMRLQVLQTYEENDVYGPDVLMNILVLLSVPFLYYLWGRNVLMSLYLLNSVFALLFYASSSAGNRFRSKLLDLFGDTGKLVIPVLIFFPLFFQLTGNVFHDSTFIFDSQGALTRVPLPISLVACFAGILLFGGYKRAHLSLGIIFLSFVLMLTSSVISTHGRGIEAEAKLILLLQFIVPMCALVLGQLYSEDPSPDDFIVEKAFLYVVAIVIPIQLLLTWLQGYIFLSPDLLVFSIYQHIQYVPLMFVCGYLIGLYALWESPKYRSMMVILAPLIGIYVSASASMMAMVSLIGGMFGLVIYRWRDGADRLLKIAFMLVIVTSGSYLNLVRNTEHFLSEKFTLRKIEQAGASLEEMKEILPNVAERIQYWRYYAGRIGESSKELLFGHSERLDRSKYPSAHNYYLDFVYNFGLLALLPLLAGMGYTVWMVYRCRRTILASASFLGLAIVVLIVLFVDNSLKVGLRQPYPGIISFFLWGILLSRLYRFSGRTVLRDVKDHVVHV